MALRQLPRAIHRSGALQRFQCSAFRHLAAWLLKLKIFEDARGFFLESWNRETFRGIGLNLDFVQDNHSHSSKHVLRGLHYQGGEAPRASWCG